MSDGVASAYEYEDYLHSLLAKGLEEVCRTPHPDSNKHTYECRRAKGHGGQHIGWSPEHVTRLDEWSDGDKLKKAKAKVREAKRRLVEAQRELAAAQRGRK